MTESTSHSDKGGGGNYWRFMAMVSTSTVIMFFLMYANSFDMDDVFWSETRFWMMFVMGAMMMVVMLLFISQTTVDDTEYMAAMIPHHSIAIMTSERASLKDPRVRELAQAIIVAQRREIAEMKYLIQDIEENGPRTEERLPEEMQQ